MRFLRTVGKSFRYGEKGFALLELLIVVSLLGILAVVTIPNVVSIIGTENATPVEQDPTFIDITPGSTSIGTTDSVLDALDIPSITISDAIIHIGPKGQLEPFGDALLINCWIQSYDSLHFDATGTVFRDCVLDNVVPDNALAMEGILIITTKETRNLYLPDLSNDVKVVYRQGGEYREQETPSSEGKGE